MSSSNTNGNPNILNDDATSMTDEQIESMIVTFVISIVSLVGIYYLFFRRKQPPQQQPQHPQHPQQRNGPPQQQQQQQQQQPQPQNHGRIPTLNPTPTNNNNSMNNNTNNPTNNDDDEEEDGVQAILSSNRRTPPHLTITTKSPNASMVLNKLYRHDGIIPFRFTLSSTYETRMSGNSSSSGSSSSTSNQSDAVSKQQLIHRKNRAKLFTKLFQKSNDTTTSNNNTTTTTTSSSKFTPPPPKGSNVVISIPTNDHLDCPILKQVLYLLGTFYNVFILLSLDHPTMTNNDNDKVDYKHEKQQLKSYIDQLRYPSQLTQTMEEDTEEEKIKKEEYYTILSEEIIPSHRIITTSSISSRVAFVRQLPKCDIMIDYEEECKNQLTRFGFRVILYTVEEEEEKKNGKSSNSLGKQLLGSGLLKKS